VIVGRTVPRRLAMLGHLVLSGAGLVIGGLVAWHNGSLRLVVIPAFAIMALWMYSTTWKRRFLIGNGTVAVLSALVPLTVGLYEIPKDQLTYGFSMVDSGDYSIEDVDLYFPL
jgi:4-hydroxybenzoate polyprenyltransferase